MRTPNRRRRALGLMLAVAAATGILGPAVPASAAIWNWNGAFASLEVCNTIRDEFAGDHLVQPCLFRDLTGTTYDGWYFKSAQEF